LQNALVFHALVFLVEAYLKPALGDSSEIGYYKVNFCNVHVELYRISMEIKISLKLALELEV